MDKINLQLTFKTALTLAAPVVLSWGEFNELSVETMSLDSFFSPKVKFGVFPLMHINQCYSRVALKLWRLIKIRLAIVIPDQYSPKPIPHENQNRR